MSLFICERCGKIDNTACSNNYWLAFRNKVLQKKGEALDISFKPRFRYFETHACCSDCCTGIVYVDGSGVIKPRDIDIENKEHWSKYGKQQMLEWESRKDGSMENATEYFNSILDRNTPVDTVENDAYLHSCKCPICDEPITRGSEETHMFCPNCGQRLRLPAFTKDEVDEGIFQREMDEYED